jgi:acyl-CoA dehydrogenase
LLVMGGRLKRQEKLTARLGDILAQMYIASAALKRFQDQGCPEEDEALLDWVCQDGMFKAQEQLIGFLRNFPAPFLVRTLGFLVFPLGRRYHPPSDRLGSRMVRLFLEPTAARDRLTGGIFISADEHDGLGRIEQAFELQAGVTDIEKKARNGLRERGFKPINERELIEMAINEKIIDQNEEQQLRAAHEAMLKAIAVDSF